MMRPRVIKQSPIYGVKAELFLLCIVELRENMLKRESEWSSKPFGLLGDRQFMMGRQEEGMNME